MAKQNQKRPGPLPVNGPPISLKMPPAMRREIESRARKGHRTASAEIRLAVQKHIAGEQVADVASAPVVKAKSWPEVRAAVLQAQKDGVLSPVQSKRIVEQIDKIGFGETLEDWVVSFVENKPCALQRLVQSLNDAYHSKNLTPGSGSTSQEQEEPRGSGAEEEEGEESNGDAPLDDDGEDSRDGEEDGDAEEA